VNSEQALQAAKREHRSRHVKKVTAWRFRVAGVRLMLFVYSATSREPVMRHPNAQHVTDYRWQMYLGDQAAAGGIIKTEWHD
jgi:hypothetical protein